jgi:hypothetical protein
MGDAAKLQQPLNQSEKSARDREHMLSSPFQSALKCVCVCGCVCVCVDVSDNRKIAKPFRTLTLPSSFSFPACPMGARLFEECEKP